MPNGKSTKKSIKMTSNDLILIKQLGYVAAGIVCISIMLYFHDKKVKKILGDFAAVFIIFGGAIRDFVREKFGI